MEYLQGTAKFVGAHEVEVELPNKEKKVLSAPHIVIASGSRSLVLSKLPGIEHTFCSEDFFNLEELPSNLFIIGGGYIGVEISCMLSIFGVKTTICMLEPSIVWPFDRDVTKLQMEIMQNDLGIKIIPEVKVIGIEKLGEKKYKVNFENHESIEAESVMNAMGRIPDYSQLDLAKAGIETLTTGLRGIKTDEYDNTTVPGVYAIGDVNAKLMLLPIAQRAGKKLAIRLFGDDKTAKVNYEAVPSIVFSHPPLAKCGLTEEEAIEKYGKDKIKVYTRKFV